MLAKAYWEDWKAFHLYQVFCHFRDMKVRRGARRNKLLLVVFREAHTRSQRVVALGCGLGTELVSYLVAAGTQSFPCVARNSTYALLWKRKFVVNAEVAERLKDIREEDFIEAARKLH